MNTSTVLFWGYSGLCLLLAIITLVLMAAI